MEPVSKYKVPNNVSRKNGISVWDKDSDNHNQCDNSNLFVQLLLWVIIKVPTLDTQRMCHQTMVPWFMSLFLFSVIRNESIKNMYTLHIPYVSPLIMIKDEFAFSPFLCFLFILTEYTRYLSVLCNWSLLVNKVKKFHNLLVLMLNIF